MKGTLHDWLQRWRPSHVRDPRIAAWRARPHPRLDRVHREQRYVVVDVETSGIDTRVDRLIAIGAVAVTHGRIDFGDAFACVLRQDVASSDANILIHGIGAQAQARGADPASALLDFLDYA